ncbi:MAG TPA: glycosyltransferase family 4 protein [Azonexus sp.]|nr:glycosyltransferase family 4 protein [Azonexus sp.]
MKVLFVHNAYQHKGGEDSVLEAEGSLLSNRGHAVEYFTRQNDEISQLSRVSVAMQTFWSSPVARDFEARLRSFKPDVVHVHNTFPRISPAVYWVAAKLGVPIVQTLHNFRLMCPQAMFLREGKVCEDCLGKLPWRGALRGCYRDSRLQSTVLASMVSLHRGLGTWQNKVTRYIALNEFCRNKFIEGGLPAERILIKPNFVDFLPPIAVDRSDFLFVGRLSAEKGIDTLVAAASMVHSAKVHVAGSGPEAGLLDAASNINALGARSHDEVRALMCHAIALVMPSIWYETFGMVAIEAFAAGLPVIASRLGALAVLIEDRVTGLLFEPGDPHSLAEAMRWALEHPAEMAAMGMAARAKYEANFTAEQNYRQLMTIYEGAIAEIKGSTS